MARTYNVFLKPISLNIQARNPWKIRVGSMYITKGGIRGKNRWQSRITEPHQGPNDFTICSGWFRKGGFDWHANLRRLNIIEAMKGKSCVYVNVEHVYGGHSCNASVRSVYARKFQARKHVKSTWQWNSTLTKTSSVKFINHDDNFPRLYPSLKNKSFSQLSYLRMDLLPTELFPCTFIKSTYNPFLKC